MNSWQVCPMCQGLETRIGGYSACAVCNAEKIISTQSGKPPSKHGGNSPKLRAVPSQVPGQPQIETSDFIECTCGRPGSHCRVHTVIY